jgi:hypothetical protein
MWDWLTDGVWLLLLQSQDFCCDRSHHSQRESDLELRRGIARQCAAYDILTAFHLSAPHLDAGAGMLTGSSKFQS